MNDFWFEETLFPDFEDPDSKDDGKAATENSASKYSSIIRVHTPRTRTLTESEIKLMTVSAYNYQYLIMRLGCEFDPGPKARESHVTFESALFQVFIQPYKENEKTRVYSLAPIELDKGGPRNVKLKLEPSITLISGAGGSIGGVETDIAIGQIAPIVRGFAGKDEMQPYWRLENHKESPLYGLRNFWLILEALPLVQGFYISCRAEGYLNTTLGRLLMRPAEQELAYRPRYKITF